MRRVILTLLIGVSLGVALTVVLRPRAATPAVPSDAPSEAELALDRPLPGVIDLKDVPLGQAIDQLARVSGAHITVDWPALEDAGLDPDRPIRLHSEGLTLDGALQQMVYPRPGPLPKLPPMFIADGGTVLLTTQERARDRRVCRSYDLTELLGSSPLPTPQGTLFPTWLQSDGPAVTFAGPVDAEYERRVRELVRFLAAAVDAGSWDTNGGKVGMCHYYCGRLVVLQTPANHRRLRCVLDALRAGAAAGLPPVVVRGDADVWRWHGVEKDWYSPPTEQLEAALDQKLPELKLDGVPLDAALDGLRERTTITIVLDRDEIHRAGLDLNGFPPVHLHLKGVTLVEALEQILRTQRPGGMTHLGYVAEGSVIRVTTAEDAERSTPIVTRIYSLRDWPLPGPRTAQAERDRATGDDEQVQNGGEPFNNTPAPASERWVRELDDVVRHLKHSVAPESLRDAGGYCSIERVGSLLIVTHTVRTHEMVRARLAALLAAAAHGGPASRPTSQPAAGLTPAPAER